MGTAWGSLRHGRTLHLESLLPAPAETQAPVSWFRPFLNGLWWLPKKWGPRAVGREGTVCVCWLAQAPVTRAVDTRDAVRVFTWTDLNLSGCVWPCVGQRSPERDQGHLRAP